MITLGLRSLVWLFVWIMTLTCGWDLHKAATRDCPLQSGRVSRWMSFTLLGLGWWLYVWRMGC